MDGTWILALELHRDGDVIKGLAWRTLFNGVEQPFVVTGRTGADGTAILNLIDAAGGFGIAPIRTTITPLQGGWARIESFAGTAYGQSIAW